MILITKLYYLGSRQNAFLQLILFHCQFPGCSDVKCAHVAELVPWEVGSERGRRFTNKCLQGAHLWRGRQWEPAKETLGCDTDKTAPLGGSPGARTAGGLVPNREHFHQEERQGPHPLQ